MAMQRRRHNIVLKRPDGDEKAYPMKQWLRQHPEHLPTGMDTHINTSHQLRLALQNKGWRVEVRANEVRLIMPAGDGDVSFVNALPSDDSETDEDDFQQEITEAQEITFGLERDLQSALRANIGQLEPGLRIIDDGKERLTEAGRIDITAIDTKGNVVVIELKAGTASPEVVTQVLAYMGAVAETDKKPVRGILVAGDFHKRVVLATRAVQTLQLKKYSFQFTFEPVR
ncbi:MAG: DUF91 domain-containing protein [Acidobacteria bacterium]|nr:DUF91 domain-containing protein [Acidobacteriota bacterium]